jgi:hypothetical protein
MDLADDSGQFAQLCEHTHPDCVIHCAGLLENQEQDKITAINSAINNTVLNTCADHHIDVVAMSSVMVLYSKAMADSKIRAILSKSNHEIISEPERIKANTPVALDPEMLEAFNPDNFSSNLAYIDSKIRAESLAQSIALSHPDLSVVMIRLGWTGFKNPFELEGEAKYSETSVYLDPIDFDNFITALLNKLSYKQLAGYHCFCPISDHPQRWISLEEAHSKLGWSPIVNIVEKYASAGASEATPFLASHKKSTANSADNAFDK